MMFNEPLLTARLQEIPGAKVLSYVRDLTDKINFDFSSIGNQPAVQQLIPEHVMVGAFDKFHCLSPSLGLFPRWIEGPVTLPTCQGRLSRLSVECLPDLESFEMHCATSAAAALVMDIRVHR